MRVGYMMYYVLLLLLLVSCTAEGQDVHPNNRQFYFPSGIALDPDENYLFVNNANADLRFDSGFVGVLDLEKVDSVIKDWSSERRVIPRDMNCERSLLAPETLVCDETPFVLSSSVRIGSFAGALKVQSLNEETLRLFSVVRSEPSITWIDFSTNTHELSCSSSGDDYPFCDENHRLHRAGQDQEGIRLVSEPFGFYVDEDINYFITTHLDSGNITIGHAPLDDSPNIYAVFEGFSTQNAVTELIGNSAIARRSFNQNSAQLYLSSHKNSQIQMVQVSKEGQDINVNASGHFTLEGVGAASESRGLLFSDNGQRLYVLNRDPPTLITIDTSNNLQGIPKNETVGAIDICSRPTSLVSFENYLYVACFDAGEIWKIDAIEGVFVATISTHYAVQHLAVSKNKRMLYGTNFQQDVIYVVDLDAGSPYVGLQMGYLRNEGL